MLLPVDVYKRQVYISYIENAKRKPSLESLIKISNALEITIDELLYGNLLYNPTEYHTDIDLLMADCTLSLIHI